MLRIVDAGVRTGIFLAHVVAVLNAPNTSRISAEPGAYFNLARNVTGGLGRPPVVVAKGSAGHWQDDTGAGAGWPTRPRAPVLGRTSQGAGRATRD